MKPILFAKNETNFTTNGLGRLDCISCEVVEERNGMYELEAEIPITGAHTDEIEMHSIIGVIPCEGSDIQAFYVYKIGKPISGRFRVYARHISYRLTDIPCMPFSVSASPQAANQTLQGFKNNAIEPCPFTFWTDITTPAPYTQKTPDSIRKRMGGVEGSVIDQFGGEYEWDNWSVKLHKARGRLANVTGISLRYGKNITDLDQEEEIASTVTGVVPYWIDTDGNNLVTLPEHAVYAPTAGNYPYHLTQMLDLSSEYENQPTVAQLRNTATLYVNKYGFGVPKVSIKVSFVDLWKSEEYKKEYKALIPRLTVGDARATANSIEGNTYTTGFQPWRSFDGDLNTSWLPHHDINQGWIKYDFEAKVTLDCLTVKTYLNGSEPLRVKTFYIEGSNDDSVWDTLTKTPTVDISFTIDGIKKHTFNLNGKAYRYLRLRTEEDLNGGSWNCNLAEIQAYGYENTLERVRLCDEITVDFEKLGVKAIAKVVKTTYDVLKERYTEIEVGSIRTTLAQAITDRDKDIDTIYLDAVSKISQAVTNATAWLTSANGYVVAVKNTDGSWKELLFMDTNDPETAINVLRINNNGLGFSTTGINGPYNNAWTIDGRMVIGGINDTAIITVLDSNGDTICTVDHRGIIMNEGYIASSDYEYTSGHYSDEGMIINITDGYQIRSPYFAIDEDGAYFNGEIVATSGRIGAATIDGTSIKVIGDYKIFNGTGSFQLRPIDYGVTEVFKLAFQIENGSATVIIRLHTSTGTSTVETITINDTEQHVSSTLSALDAADEEQYYTLIVSGSSTDILLYQTLLAYIGQGGIRGVLQGIFKGYLESDTGKIHGNKYDNSGLYGDLTVKTESGYNNASANITLDTGSSNAEPNITRTYNGNTESVAWGHKHNYIDQEIIAPTHTASEGDLIFKGTQGTSQKDLYRYENGNWIKVDLRNITISDTDIVAGTTPLETGALYLVYE